MDIDSSDLAAQLYAAIAAETEEETPAEKSKAAGPDVIEIDDEDSVVLIQSSYNLSDVLDVIQNQTIEVTPPETGDEEQEQDQQRGEDGNERKISNTESAIMYNNNQTHQMTGHPTAGLSQQPPTHRVQQQQQQSGQNAGSSGRSRSRAFTEITEQPAPKALRFRYECEGRSAGSIPGIRSTAENKTFPSIRVSGHRGDAFVVVSCVTKDPPFKPHPHNLVGRDCKTGVCTVKMSEDNMSITFNNLGIQCIRKKDIEEALKKREEIKVDPFKTGFGHRNQPSSIDLNAIRLCFQVFVSSPSGLVAIQPVISEPIFDKKAMSELVITKLSHCSAPVSGGKEVILLCEKVAKEDIAVRFYEEQDGQVVWEANGDFQHNNVHKQVAISFKTPPYRLLQLDHVTRVFMQLKRPSDGATSDPVTFDYLPVEAEQMPKRKKIEDRKSLYQLIQDREQQQHQQPQQMQDYRQTGQQANAAAGGFMNIKVDPIKQEPRDHSPANFNLFGGYRVIQGTPSPQPGSPFHSPMHQQDNQLPPPSAPQALFNNLFANIPETLPVQNLFPNPFQPPGGPVSPATCLPASLQHQQQQQQQQQAQNTFMQYPANTQWNNNNNNNQSMRPLNDLSSSTTGTAAGQPGAASSMNPFLGHQNILGGQQQVDSQSVPMNILPEGLLDSSDFSQLNDLLPNSTLPSLSRLEQDQENMTDSLTKLILKNLEGYPQGSVP